MITAPVTIKRNGKTLQEYKVWKNYISSLDTNNHKNLISLSSNVAQPFYSVEKLGCRSNIDPVMNKNESLSSIESKKS